MAPPSSVDVVIIGAGPTGLMLACQLSLHPHVSFRVIDKNESGIDQSRALVVQARSLEIFAQLNLVEKALSQGTFGEGMSLFFQGQSRFRLDFTRFREKQQLLLTRYPYVLFLEQSSTEELLESFLNEHNVRVERTTEAAKLIELESTDGTGVEVVLASGETIRAKYVCACDGARSIVRHKLNLAFEGRTYSESLFLADCQVAKAPVAKNEFGIFCESSGFAGIFPMANGRYRLVGTINEEKHKEVPIDFNDAVAIVKTRTRHFDMNINDCKFMSIYHSHHRRITDFRNHKRFFLLGDAAHIHSPLGGQGMNTGLQDAHNLAWKLAYVLNNSANDRLLESYHDERSCVAEKLVNTTDRLFAFITSSHWLTKLFRIHILPFVLQFVIQPVMNSSHTLRQSAFGRLSQLAISYRLSNVYDYGASAGTFHPNTPQPGDRFPYAIFDPCHYHLVLFENQKSEKVDLFLEFVKEQYSKLIYIHNAQEENYPIQFQGAILVRPDGYIAYRTTVFNIQHFQCYMAQFFPKQ